MHEALLANDPEADHDTRPSTFSLSRKNSSFKDITGLTEKPIYGWGDSGGECSPIFHSPLPPLPNPPVIGPVAATTPILPEELRAYWIDDGRAYNTNNTSNSSDSNSDSNNSNDNDTKLSPAGAACVARDNAGGEAAKPSPDLGASLSRAAKLSPGLRASLSSLIDGLGATVCDDDLDELVARDSNDNSKQEREFEAFLALDDANRHTPTASRTTSTPGTQRSRLREQTRSNLRSAEQEAKLHSSAVLYFDYYSHHGPVLRTAQEPRSEDQGLTIFTLNND